MATQITSFSFTLPKKMKKITFEYIGSAIELDQKAIDLLIKHDIDIKLRNIRIGLFTYRMSIGDCYMWTYNHQIFSTNIRIYER